MLKLKNPSIGYSINNYNGINYFPMTIFADFVRDIRVVRVAANDAIELFTTNVRHFGYILMTASCISFHGFNDGKSLETYREY